MQLLRIVTTTFTPDPKQPKSWQVQFGRSKISTMKISGENNGCWKVILIAEIEIDFPDITDDGFVRIPDEERRELEFSLETIANMISVLGRCKRSISSVTPSAALIPADNTELDQLNATKGIYSQQYSIASAAGIDMIDSDLLGHLSDRFHAVALVAEARSHSLSVGKFHEYVRVFESAFALPFSQLSKKLRQFLKPVYGYTSEEIGSWASTRDPLTHADGKKSNQIYLDSDARKYTQRMEQAAYDVLFNKKLWHNRSSARREVWAPVAATTSPTGDILIKQGSEPTISFQVIDEFGVFPKDLNAIITDPPKDWWSKFAEQDSK